MVAAPKDTRTVNKADRKARQSQARKASGFYGRVLEEAERILFAEARQVEGLDEEIALLRMKLAQSVQEHPEDLALMAKGMDILVKAVSTRYRLSQESKEDLASSLAGIFEQLGPLFLPEAFRDR